LARAKHPDLFVFQNGSKRSREAQDCDATHLELEHQELYKPLNLSDKRSRLRVLIGYGFISQAEQGPDEEKLHT
jgi:hypothetical protein